MAIGTWYRGDAGFDGVFAAFVLGWGVAAVLHLAFGSPAGRPTAKQVAGALDELGVVASNVRLAPAQARGYTQLLADAADGSPLHVRVYGRDAADTQIVAKVWRFFVYKDSGPTLTHTRLQQVEHEALCQIVAEEEGVHVPALVAAGVAGPSAAVLVTSEPHGERLIDIADQDRALRLLWRDVARLRGIRVAHGALDLEHVAVIDGVPTIMDFSLASISAPQQRLDLDVANLLASSALLVGAERAVAAAQDGIGHETVAAASSVTHETCAEPRHALALRHNKNLLDELQQQVSTATDVAVLAPIELRRVKPITVVMVIGLLFALWVVLGQIGSISNLIDTLANADWAWVVACLVLTQLTQVSYAFTTIGSVDEKVPLGPAVLMQYAVSFTNMVLPTGAASTLMNIRFLQKQGSSVAVATSSGLLCGLSGTVTQFFLFVITAIAVGQAGELSEVGGSGDTGDDGKLILLLVVIAAVLLAIVFIVPKWRRFTRDKVWPELENGFRNLWSVLTTPRKLFFVMGGSIGAELLNSLGLGAALLAYGASLPIARADPRRHRRRLHLEPGTGAGRHRRRRSVAHRRTHVLRRPTRSRVGSGRHLPPVHDIPSANPRQLRHQMAHRERRPLDLPEAADAIRVLRARKACTAPAGPARTPGARRGSTGRRRARSPRRRSHPRRPARGPRRAPQGRCSDAGDRRSPPNALMRQCNGAA